MRLKIFSIAATLFLLGCATSQQSSSTTPSVSTPAFSIFPGDPIYAEATVNSDGNITLAKVEMITNPSITLIFTLTRSDDGMMLSVKNPLDKTVKYHLDMIDFKGNPHNTSSCPVRAGLSVFESWPHPIPEIRVSNVHVALKNEENRCTY